MNIIDRNMSKAWIDGMARYSIVTNWARNFPDIKDSFKPVQRRIIYTMAAVIRATKRSDIVKSANITGQTMGKFHPHGDVSIYDAMKPMATPFESNIPLIISQGNFGNINGEKQAAQRYTEAYLSPFTMECVIGDLLSTPTMVPWRQTYDDKDKEPVYFPCKVPLLLINGISGIGVGKSVDIPPYNLGEVIDATIALIDNPNLVISLIPDHPIPCQIIDTDWEDISNKGNGKYKARAYIDTIQDKKGNSMLVIRSLPSYGTTKVKLKIESLIADKKLPQVISVDDETRHNDINIVVRLKPGSDTEFVKEALYKYTQCEESFRVNMEVMDGVGSRDRISITAYLKEFINFAVEHKFKKYNIDYSNLNTRYHKVDAFVKVLASGQIDKIITMIRKKDTTGDNELIEFLISKIGLTDVQASYIINTSIKQLSKGHLKRYQEEIKEIEKNISMIEKRITNDQLLLNDVREELLYIKSKYAYPRRCKVVKISENGNIPQGTFRVIVTDNNFIRKISENDPISSVRGDNPKFFRTVDNTESILLFDSKGRVFRLPVHKIPVMGRNDPGQDIRFLIKGLTADIISMIYEPALKNALKAQDKKRGRYYITVLSKMNTIKKLELDDFASVPPSGIIYSKVFPEDEIVSVDIIADNMDVIVYSGHKALRISSNEIPCYKRNTIGVAAMNTNEPLEGLAIIYPEAIYTLVVTKSGMVNKFSMSGFEKSANRNKAGGSVIKLKKGDSILYMVGATDGMILKITTSSHTVLELKVSDIPHMSSISSGIKALATRSDAIVKAELIVS